MEKTEIVIGDLMVKHVDSMNWQLFERREVTENKNPEKNKRVGEVDWMPLPAFYGTLKPAIAKARDLYRERGLPERAELKEAVDRMEKADADFLRALDKALGGVVA